MLDSEGIPPLPSRLTPDTGRVFLSQEPRPLGNVPDWVQDTVNRQNAQGIAPTTRDHPIATVWLMGTRPTVGKYNLPKRSTP